MTQMLKQKMLLSNGRMSTSMSTIKLNKLRMSFRLRYKFHTRHKTVWHRDIVASKCNLYKGHCDQLENTRNSTYCDKKWLLLRSIVCPHSNTDIVCLEPTLFPPTNIFWFIYIDYNQKRAFIYFSDFDCYKKTCMLI